VRGWRACLAVSIAAIAPACAGGPPAWPAAGAANASYRPLHQGYFTLDTGLYFREDDDLVLNTAMRVVLRRTYNSGDAFSRQFGINATHNGEWWLYGDGDPRVSWGDLILADGGRIHFTRISPGNTQDNAVLRHDTTPTEFNGALLSWNGSTWDMKLTDGSLAVFRDCQTKEEHCALLERRDAQGHRIEYVRDSSQKLLRIESDGQSISFEYDGSKRIVRASATSGRSVLYTYDDRGRLVLASYSSGRTRSYAYDDHNNLTEIREPGRIVRNWYDETGRVRRQEVRDSDDDNDPYIAIARYRVVDKAVVQADFNEGDGVVRHWYNSNHYEVMETFDADGPAPITFRYDRDERTNVVKAATLSCRGLFSVGAYSVSAAVEGDRQARRASIQQHCFAWPRK